jgi:hypothetical protein
VVAVTAGALPQARSAAISFQTCADGSASHQAVDQDEGVAVPAVE